MALYKKLDLWSITDGLDRMMDYCYNGNGTEHGGDDVRHRREDRHNWL